MGGRGSFDISSQSIPLERRQYHQIGSHNGIKIIEGITIKNAKTPVMSNTANTAYAVWSQNANRIKSILFYTNHVLYKQIDVDGSNSHWHKVEVNKTTGEIGRISHDPNNVFSLSKSQWKLVNYFKQWKKKK